MFSGSPNAFSDFRDTSPLTFGNYADQALTFPSFVEPTQGGMFGSPGGFTNEFDALSGLLSNLYQSGRNARLTLGRKPGQPAGRDKPTSITPDAYSGNTGALANDLVGMAVAKFGESAGPVMRALLRAEGGLGGAIGDLHLNRIGSHGPLQFYGGGGQLNNFAAALGVDLDTAGTFARQNPRAAVQWALENYLGNALRAGIARGEGGEALLRTVLGAQNPGALNDPTRYGHYLTALNQAMYQPMQGPTMAEAGMVGGNPWNIAFGFNQPYGAAQFNAAIPNHRGVDLTIPGAPNNGKGRPFTAFRPGTVESAGNMGGASGNGVIIRGTDGLYYRYFHLDTVAVAPGQFVSPTTQLGTVGETGSPGFPHLHFEVSRAANGDPMNALIDPRPYMSAGVR